MKYFTPELLDRYGSDDPNIYHAAEAEWDEKCQQYNAYLDSVKRQWPAGLQQLEEKYYLHDSQICSVRQVDRTFVVVLQLDNPPKSLLKLTYSLLEDVAENIDVAGERVEWQYDEIEQLNDDPPRWLQSILLSNGREIKLHFREIEVREIIPSLRNGADIDSSDLSAAAVGYASLLRNLHYLTSEGKGDSEEAEAVASRMDAFWHAMNRQEQERMRELAAHLNSLLEPEE